MAKRRFRDKQAANLVKAKVHAGIQNAMFAHASFFRDAVDQARRSRPGEYPGKETGRGQASIGSGVTPREKAGEIEGRSGVTAEGMHLVELELGVHPFTGEPWRRKGMDHVFIESADEIREAFKAGAESVEAR